MSMSKAFFTYLIVLGSCSSAYAAVQRTPGQVKVSMRCEQELANANASRSAQAEAQKQGSNLRINGTNVLQQKATAVSIAPHLRSGMNCTHFESAQKEEQQPSSNTGRGGASVLQKGAPKGPTMTSIIEGQPKEHQKHKSDPADKKQKPDGSSPPPQANAAVKCNQGEYFNAAKSACERGCGDNTKQLEPDKNGNCECKDEHKCYEQHLEEEIKVLIKEMSKEAQTKISEIVKQETANSPPAPGCPSAEEGSTSSSPHTATSKHFYQAGCAHCHCKKDSANRHLTITTLFLMVGAFFASGLF